MSWKIFSKMMKLEISVLIIFHSIIKLSSGKLKDDIKFRFITKDDTHFCCAGSALHLAQALLHS